MGKKIIYTLAISARWREYYQHPSKCDPTPTQFYEKIDGMNGVNLAGGKGSRLVPLTEITNQQLPPVGREPMIWHPLRQITPSGVTIILIVTATGYMGEIVNSPGAFRGTIATTWGI